MEQGKVMKYYDPTVCVTWEFDIVAARDLTGVRPLVCDDLCVRIRMSPDSAMCADNWTTPLSMYENLSSVERFKKLAYTIMGMTCKHRMRSPMFMSGFGLGKTTHAFVDSIDERLKSVEDANVHRIVFEPLPKDMVHDLIETCFGADPVRIESTEKDKATSTLVHVGPDPITCDECHGTGSYTSPITGAVSPCSLGCGS